MRVVRGDTIIELMLAFSVFSLASVGTITIMNRGVAISQQSLETSLVRAQMDGQAETIRYLRDTSGTGWDTIKDKVVDESKVAPLAPASCPTAAEVQGMGGFFMNGIALQSVSAGNFTMPSTYAQIEDDMSHGIWAQITDAEGSDAANPVRAYDVYVHACWDSVGNTHAPATLGTIVRIYDR